MIGVTIALLGVIASILLWSTYRRRTYFKTLGLSGPPPMPIFGNILFYGNGMHEAHEAWSRKYGKVYGIFEGARRSIMVSDLDMIQEIFIKRFNNFCDRQSFPLRPAIADQDLLSLKGDRWKMMRSTISPAFSTSKIQKMTSLVNSRTDHLVKRIQRNVDAGKGDINLTTLIGSFVIEAGALCAFATDIDSQNEDNSKFIDYANEFFKGFKEMQTPWMIILMFPWMEPVLKWLGYSIHPVHVLNFFHKIVMEIIAERKADPNQKEYVDFLQLIMKAHNFQDEDIPEDERVHVDYKRALTDLEVTATAVLFFLGNHETTTSTLSFIAYLLATNPDVQDRLIAEIDDVIGDRTNVTYQDMANLPYLDMVASESMRMYPPVIEFDRICQSDCVVKGVRIPKGTLVAVPVWVVHHDPEYWPDPFKFDPERFTAENKAKHHPMQWLGFGAGPRKCVGYRFARLEITQVLVRTLQKYRLEPCEQTEIPPKLGKHGLIIPDKGVVLRFTPRNK